MENILYSIGGILIPFIGTTLGSSFVFFMKKNMNEKFQKMIIGFASGVMIAAAVWSLIIPSIEMTDGKEIFVWLPAAVGMILGVLFLLFINNFTDKFEKKSNGKSFNMLMFSVTLHNIPERNGSRGMFCRFLIRQCRNCINRSDGFSNWNCNTKYS